MITGSHGVSTGGIAGSMNFGDFGDFGFNFVHFSCPHQSDLVKMNAAYDDYYT